MERLLRILSLALVVMLGGCTAMMESSTYGTSDLYVTDNRIKVAEEMKARAEAERAEAEARKAMWEARLAEAEYYAATSENYNTIVADDYESAYARRLYGFNSPTYRLPSSYYALATSDAMRYATAYDPAYYNIMVSGDQVWVEPKYVTSMFGAWGATNVTFGIYASPWAFGWGVYSSPFYYTMWGYPHYSWYDWNWNMCYNPFHWGGYYPGYYHPHYGYPHHGYPHHGHNPQPPHYRPDNKPGGGHIGSGGSYAKNERRHSASRYTSPTSNQNYGKNLNGSRVGATIRNTGSSSSGINHSTVNRGNTTVSKGNTRYSTTTSNSTTTQKRSAQSSNFRSSSSSSSRSSSSSSSSYRSSSSSSSSRSSSSSSSSRSSGGTTSSRR